ncbi:TPR-like protein [Mycena latifolia]|nr:TPR-like protein [Mycena latifolia]
MSELKRVIKLHSIRVTSLTNPHDDLPGDMKMFAHLIIGENIFLQTLPVASEHDQMSWKLGFGCNIPPHALVFSVAVLRQSETEGTRLVGYVEIGRGEVLESVESNRSFQLQFNKVNPDGPSLKFSAGFSVSELPYREVSGLDLIDMPENSSASVKGRGIRNELQKMFEDSKKTHISVDALQLWVMHERILLCSQSNDSRARWLNILGDIISRSYQESGTVDDLIQAVCAYNDAVRDAPGSVIYLADIGTSLLRRFERFGSLRDINRSVEMLKDAVRLTPDGHPDKPGRLNNLGHSLSRHFEQLGDLSDLNKAIMMFKDAVQLTPDGHPDKPRRLSNLGNSLLGRFDRLGDLSDLNKSIMMKEDAVRLTPDGHPDKPGMLNNLGNSLCRRFDRLGDLSDLNKAIMMFKDAVQFTPDGHPDKPGRLSNLGSSLLGRFDRLGDLSDLNKSIMMKEDAVRLTPDGHPDKPRMLNNLGNSLLGRFERLGDLSDLNKSIMMFEDTVRLTPDGHTDKPGRLSNLGNSLLGRFDRLGDLSDLNKSIMMKEDAVRLTPDGHPDKPGMLNNLGNSLCRRFDRLGDLSDLNKAIMMFEDAVQLTPDGHPDKPRRLNNLGNSLFHRFERFGDLSDLNKSIMMKEDAVRLAPDGHPDKPAMLSNLGNSLLGRFDRLGDLSDLNKSIMMKEDAVRLTPDGHPDKPGRLNNLGNSLCHRFDRLGDLSDLNKSIMMFEDTVRLTPDGHPEKPGNLNNLGKSLLGRFEQFGDLSDLNKSIMMKEDAVRLTPDGHPDKPRMLNNLGNSLFRRFERLGDLSDLNKSIMMFEDTVRLTPDGHPDKPAVLNNLGSSLLGRFEWLGDLSDLNKSIRMKEDAVRLTPDGHPEKPGRLNNLGHSLFRHFEQLGDLSDLNKAIMMFKDAVQLTPDGHPDKPGWLTNLGHSLSGRFERLHDPRDSQELLLHYTSAACSTTGPVSIRFDAAKSWAKYAYVHQPSSILRAYTTAIELLPELAWLGLSITDRHNNLSQAGQVVRDAASAAIAVHDYQKAVEWLDQGRSVIWGQLLNLRTPVDELRDSHPGLADQLVSLSTSLETAGTRSSAVADATQPQSLQSIANQSHAHALQRNGVLQQIRELSGFERFLLSKPISELSLAAKMGPVAIVNISEYGCDALILLPGLGDNVIHVPLSDFTIHEAQAMANSLASIVGTSGRTDRLQGSREGYIDPDEIFTIILSELWVKIVQPVLNGIAITTPVSQDLGRIWWCATGPLAFLPIHAAGLYGEDHTSGSKLSDFLVSSYTPSLTALIQGFRPQPESQEDLQLLAVTQPSAEGQCYIPGTQKEIKYIRQHAAGKVHVLWLDKHMATIDEVQKGMRKSRWVHFACHGVQSASPTESALLLAGSSRLTLSNIIGLSLPNADLAFLSACQTATGSKRLQDESVHLAAGMLLAGYRGVIGTMWSIGDNDAPQVAGDVYAHLLEASPPDSTRAAEALHLAVRKLREQPGAKKSFLHWVPFIHFGV